MQSWYGDQPDQFGALHVPDDVRSSVVVVLIHGGFWRARYTRELMVPLALDLVQAGYVVWNLEYRRVGHVGGGWPGTLDDVAAGIDHLATLAPEHGLDLGRVVVVGHSAGGHLALWSGSRHLLNRGDPGWGAAVRPAMVIGQAPVTRLLAAAEAGLGSGAVVDFLQAEPGSELERWRVAQPAPDGSVRAVAVVGTRDDVVPPEFSAGDGHDDEIALVVIPGADHFDMIDPEHAAWAAVRDLIAAVEE